ncbi:MarC family protein [Pacificibacter marinus]|uniref:MarC family protein n=1 Tax=Pacificibacter marinus TaxID=658057 RepID=UPI000A27091F|nr:MarC family protein [Pacificibacter marinus]
MDLQFLITAFFTLFVIIDPIGLMPLFVALTTGSTTRQRRSIALRAVSIGFGILVLFGFFGEAVLEFAGISMAAFRIAGGLLLFLTALDMLFERRTKRREDQANQPDIDDDDPSVFPLATPLIAGPGAIASMILLTGETNTTLEFASVFVVLAVVLLIALTLFVLGGLLERALGPTGVNVVTRILGMLLTALSIQFILDGLRDVGALPY